MTSTFRRRTIMVAGMIAADPYQGGATWAVLQYVLGLVELGHDVYLIEPIARAKVTPSATSLSASCNAQYFRAVAARFGLEQRSALLDQDSKETVGVPYEELRRVAQHTDLILNVSGMLTDRTLLEPVPVRAYLDLDPAFNQLWQAADGLDMRFEGHTHFVTVGGAIGRPGCLVPTCGRSWLATLPPVVLDEWPVGQRIDHDAFTTVGHWRAYGSITCDGVFYGQKAHALRRVVDLPMRTTQTFALALAIHSSETADIDRLAAHRWGLLDPDAVASTPDDYRSFVQRSKAEFGLAKSGYSDSACGWFSDRSACYLASGRPVLAQETGFSAFLPTGRGLLAFESVDSAAAGADAIAGDYAGHSLAARAIAEEYFDSRKVLPSLLRMVEAD